MKKTVLSCILLLFSLLLFMIPAACDEEPSATLHFGCDPKNAGTVNVDIIDGTVYEEGSEANMSPIHVSFGTQVKLTAIPDEGWEFDRWSVYDCTDDDWDTSISYPQTNPLNASMEHNNCFTALFYQTCYLQAWAAPEEGGTVNVTSDSPMSALPDNIMKCKLGGNVSLTAVSKSGYRFVRWEGWRGVSGDTPDEWGYADTVRTERTFVHEMDGNWSWRAVFEPGEETPEGTPAAAQSIDAVLSATARCEGYEPDCQGFLTIVFEGKDMTGNAPITRTVVTVNGEVWHDSATVRRDTIQGEVECGELYTVILTVTNSKGQTASALEAVMIPDCPEAADEAEPTPTEAVPTPTSTGPTPTATPPDVEPEEVLQCNFGANANCQSGEECSCTLTVSYSGVDLTGGSMKVARVVLEVNGEVWHDSGSISVVSYSNSNSRQVGCGGTFFIEVTVTNVYGQSVACYDSITTPSPGW